MANQCDIEEVKHQALQKFLEVYEKFEWDFNSGPYYSTGYFDDPGRTARCGEWCIGDRGIIFFSTHIIYRFQSKITKPKYKYKKDKTLTKASFTTMCAWDKVLTTEKEQDSTYQIIKGIFDKEESKQKELRCQEMKIALEESCYKMQQALKAIEVGEVVTRTHPPHPWWKFWA